MRPDMTPILLMGDPARNKVQTMPGAGYATVRVELPAQWDRLMAERGYAPLSDFFLKPTWENRLRPINRPTELQHPQQRQRPQQDRRPR
jgi:hypothetical protein